MTSKTSRFVDLQLFVGPGGLDDAARRAANEALFVVYEPLRLWLREARLRAPFAKLLITIVDARTMATHHGQVSVAGGVCEVLHALPLGEAVEHVRDHRWALRLVSDSLERVERQRGWHSAQLAAHVNGLAECALPLTHFFSNLVRTDRRSGVTFSPWISTTPGSTKIGVRLANGHERDVLLVAKPGPLFIEDEFPMKRAVFRRHRFVLVGSDGTELAGVDVPDADGENRAP